MTDYQHQSLAAGRWFKLSLAEQMANIGSEFERVLSWRKKNQPNLSDKAFVRMHELFDLTVQDSRWKNHRLKELLRLRESINGELINSSDNELYNSVKDLQKYFLYFGILARQDKIKVE